MKIYVKLNFVKLLVIICDIVLGFDYVYYCGVIYCDLKFFNVLLVMMGWVCLIDFGLVVGDEEVLL